MERDNTHSAPLKIPAYRMRISPSTHVSITLTSFTPFSPAPVDDILLSKAVNMASLVRTSSHGAQTPNIDDHRASTNTFGYVEGENDVQHDRRVVDQLRLDISTLQTNSARELQAVKTDMAVRFAEVNGTLVQHSKDLSTVKTTVESLQTSVEGLKKQGDKHEALIHSLHTMMERQEEMMKRQQESLDSHSRILKLLASRADVDILEDLPALQATGSAVALPEVVVTHTPTSSVSSTEPQFRASTPPSPPSRAGPSTLPVPFSQTAPSYRLSEENVLLSLPNVLRLRTQSEPDVREALGAREGRETFRPLEADRRPEVKKGFRDVAKLFRKTFSNKSG
ncbi:hypothetical protein HETIRDRAFT_386706 [Heterobasidion irregulare TC 32-1]|uniref:Uncharacterized protein n=1 Tax=Heterobasidion irregulare (strain TC 32-1) TaxID=747525 RepID=W4JZM2_HETIT|nr:uncharacterized protein HETIRDRAFT_386706 [Heterobasidion irregulare TC 32-1]ETW78540.1 hypothetical protein HETIRDRAFT_386706 [Heterobasidion irregulare TC 32-1]